MQLSLDFGALPVAVASTPSRYGLRWGAAVLATLAFAAAVAGCGGDEAAAARSGTGNSGGEVGETSSGQGGSSTGTGGPCTVYPQSGCPDGQACDVAYDTAASADTTCRDVTVPGVTGSACDSITACAAGWQCNGLGEGTLCHAFCDDDSQCQTSLPGEGLCNLKVVDGDGQIVPGMHTCSDDCDVLSGAGCPVGFSCQVVGEQDAPMRWFTYCTLAGSGAHGAACSTNADCQVGSGCFNSVCYPYCNYTTNPVCQAGTCLQFTDHPVLHGEEYGICI